MRTPYLFLMLATLTATLATAAPASAQGDPGAGPIGPFAVDARGVFPRFKENPLIASGIDVSPANLPTRGLGVVFGAHWYPLRKRAITIGVGGELLLTRASRTLDDTTSTAETPTVTTSFTSLAPQVSFNFGKRNGWSYISGGIGRASFNAEREDAPLSGNGQGTPGTQTINYGGGARWFAKEHLAFSVDLRFYAVNPREADGQYPALPRMTLTMVSAGLSFK